MPWNEETIRWLSAASDYTGFHRRLATRMLPCMSSGGSLVDLGCGAGLIDLELHAHFDSITCVDENEAALSFLDAEAHRRAIPNLRLLCADALSLQSQWDTVTLLFFGRIGENIHTLLPLCRDRVLAVVRADAQGQLGPEGHHPTKKYTVASTAQMLDAQKIRYTLLEDALEYGQPLASYADAKAFVRTYSPNISEKSVRAYLDKHLQTIAHPRYSLYLPNRKAFGIFTIRRDENA